MAKWQVSLKAVIAEVGRQNLFVCEGSSCAPACWNTPGCELRHACALPDPPANSLPCAPLLAAVLRHDAIR